MMPIEAQLSGNRADEILMTDAERAIADLKRAVAFFDQVILATPAERAAVGDDHYDWIVAAARKVADTA